MKQCPRCYQITLLDEPALNALSRRDNKTYICNDCGEEEALIDTGYGMIDEREKTFIKKLRR